MYGFDLVLAVILVNLLKYPFFEIGTRYTIVTGRPLQEAYKELGVWALGIFLLITVGTMFIIVGVVTMVTAGLLQNLFGIPWENWVVSGGFLSVATLILVLGKYKVLDWIIRVVVILMTLTTVVSLLFSIVGAPEKAVLGESFQFSRESDILFLVALLGWMPIPIEAAVWQSDWTLESRKQYGGVLPKLKYALIDFKVGYFGTTFLAIVFLSLGAVVMHGSGEEFSPKAVEFSDQLIQMIGRNLGSWAYPWIATGASMTMVSTVFTCLDAYPRVLTKTIQVALPNTRWNSDLSYRILLLITASGSILFLYLFQKNMRTMVDFATSVSFVAAPFLAVLHYRIAISERIRKEAPIGLIQHILSIVGILFLTLFTLYFLYLEYLP